MIELRTYDLLPDGEDLAAWEGLLEADPNATVFHRPEYLRTWHDVLGARYPMRIHIAEDEGEVVGVIPDVNDRAGSPTGPLEIRRFPGGDEVTDYRGPLSLPDRRYDVAYAYVANLVDDVDWDELNVGGLSRDSGWGDALRRAVDQHGLNLVHEEIEDVCPVVDLAGGYDAYLKRLSGRTRQELQRKARKLARDVGELELVELTGDEAQASVGTFLEQAAASFPDKASFFQRDDVRAWFDALTKELAADGTVRIHQLLAGGLPAATTVSLVGQRRWGLYNSAFDTDLAAFAPGMVIIWMLIERACDEGCDVFDLLRGSEEYKYRFGAQDRELERLVVGRA